MSDLNKSKDISHTLDSIATQHSNDRNEMDIGLHQSQYEFSRSTMYDKSSQFSGHSMTGDMTKFVLLRWTTAVRFHELNLQAQMFSKWKFRGLEYMVKEKKEKRK